MVDTRPGLLRPGTRSSRLLPNSVTSEPRGEVSPLSSPLSSSVSMLISPELWCPSLREGEWPESVRR